MRVLALFLLPAALSAQLSFFTVKGVEETPLSGIVALGAVPTGDTLQVQFRVRNTGDSLAILQSLKVVGDGFRLYQNPPIPFPLLKGFAVDFYVQFSSDQAVSDARAILTVNSSVVTLSATATSSATVSVIEEDGSETRRSATDVTPFAPTERGSATTRTFIIRNPNSTSLTTNVNVSGESFRLATIVPVPLTLGGGQSFPLTIRFEPSSAGIKKGALLLDGRSFGLEGNGTDPLPSRPQIMVPTGTGESGKQLRIGINFETPVRANLRGTLKVEFQPLQSTPDDPAISFLPNMNRIVEFQVNTSESQASFGGQKEVVLQSGTTAGTLTLTAELSGFRSESKISIPPAPAVLDRLSATKVADGLTLIVTGFDNSRSLTELTFTFYDLNGAVVDPGPVKSSVGAAFDAYFRTSTTGGMFSMRAIFPVTGRSQSITDVQIEARNSVGVSRTERIKF